MVNLFDCHSAGFSGPSNDLPGAMHCNSCMFSVTETAVLKDAISFYFRIRVFQDFSENHTVQVKILHDNVGDKLIGIGLP